jgi:two-component system, cell cycle sensor histidine kinase and response regulator CckA
VPRATPGSDRDRHPPAGSAAYLRLWTAFCTALRAAGSATHTLVFLMVASLTAFVCFQAQVESEHRTVLTLSEIETHVYRVSALEWRVAAGHALSSDVAWGFERVRQGMSHRLAEIQDLGDSDPIASHVVTTYRNYVKHVDAELSLAREGRTAEAEEYDQRYVDPAFEVLVGALTSARQVYAKRADDARRWLLLGQILTGALAMAALTVLALHVTRTSRRADEAEASTREWQASEQRYRTLFESNPQPMWVLDPAARRFLAVNDAALAFYGYDRSTFLRLAVQDVCAQGGCDTASDWAAGGLRNVTGATHLRRDGTEVPVDLAVHPIVHEGRTAVLAVVRDMSERQRLEQRIREAQRLETLGRLAGGVAHDFNNLVTAIVGYTQLLMGELKTAGNANANTYAHEVWQAARRAASLTQQMLNFGRTRGRASEPVALGVVVGDLQPMLMRLLGEDVLLQVAVSPGPWRVRGDRGLLEQLVMNLAVRARECMPRGGRLSLSLQGVTVASEEARLRGVPSGGEFVELVALDSGPPLADDVRARLRGPRGTAEPLSPEAPLFAVRDVARGLGGGVLVECAAERGTTVRVLLPHDTATEAATAPVPADPGAAPIEGGAHGTLLLVEDEGSVRDVVRRQLEALGYKVLECPNAERALAVASAHVGPIDLMLTDVVMPGLNGRELADALRATRPDMRVLYMSGYTDDHVVRQGIADASLEFLPKPFEIGQLAARLEQVLGEPRAAA